MSVITFGYLEAPYLLEPYLAAEESDGTNSQVTFVINAQHTIKSQVNRIINATHHAKSQTNRQIPARHFIKAQALLQPFNRHHIKAQIKRQITALHLIKSQTNRRIDTTHHAKAQINRNINAAHHIKGQADLQTTQLHGIKVQVNRKISALHHIKGQTNRRIDAAHHVRSQSKLRIDQLHAIKVQVNRKISILHHIRTQVFKVIDAAHPIKVQVNLIHGIDHHIGVQVSRLITNFKHKLHTEVHRGKILEEHCEDAGYLSLPYLTYPYLADIICARLGAQVNRIAFNKFHVNSQATITIPQLHKIKAQVKRRIDIRHHVHSQILRLQSRSVHMQIACVLYNVTNLRILMDFPSRGVSGTNWNSNSTMAGDFDILNVNTDIVEQVWRSDTGTVSGIILTCDSEVPQGIFVDTLAFLNHTMTSSASVVWQAANDAGFASVLFTEVFEMTTSNFYYIAPTLPLVGYRYHRFLISDPTNSNDHIEIGTIVFGSAIIFQGENIVDHITKNTKHFADKVATEAFSNVSNDRAIKFAVGLELKNLDFNRGNYRSIRSVFDFARTSLKCLWIPTPQYAARFATFAKLAAIPDESHNVKSRTLDFIDFNLTTDESL